MFDLASVISATIKDRLSDYSIREIRLEPTAEEDNELWFASNTVLLTHPSEKDL